MKKKGHIIKIPHLKATLVVYKKGKGDRDYADGYSRHVCPGEYELTLKLPIKGKVTGSFLTHEIIHIIQFIVEDHTMSFLEEREHLAYLAGWLFLEICNI